VVGGGIAGLAAAWEVVTSRPGSEVTVFEPGHLGGKIATEQFGGRPVDCGPDAFLTRVPEGIQLCRELGIEHELVAPAADRVLLSIGGRLRQLPAGLVLGVPGRLGPLVAGRVLPFTAFLRASADLILPATVWSSDVAVAELVGRRFGRQVVERLVDPLLGGIHAGSTDRLSVEAIAPQLAQSARLHRSLLLGLRGAPSTPPGPLFFAPLGGMGRLVDRLVDALGAKGTAFAVASVAGLRPAGDRDRVILDPGGSFDAVVLATPAAEAARLLEDVSPQASAELAAIRSASVAVVTMAYAATALRLPPGASGVLIPRIERRSLTACSFGSAKWPHWSDPDTTVLRASVGRDGDDDALCLDDQSLVEQVHVELTEVLGAKAAPSAWRVSRWPNAFPQYDVGHLARIDRIESALSRDLASVAVAGASYRGSGIPACIASGRRAGVMIGFGGPRV